MIKGYIDKIIDSKDEEKMEELANILEDSLIKLKSHDVECFKKYKLKLLGMASDYKFDEDTAHGIVEDMKPYGEHWSYPEIIQTKNQYGLMDLATPDLYIVMNSAYNDYKELFGEDLNDYIKYSELFIKDEDAVPNKIWIYYNKIPKKDN